jgi:hypothetical protein
MEYSDPLIEKILRDNAERRVNIMRDASTLELHYRPNFSCGGQVTVPISAEAKILEENHMLKMVVAINFQSTPYKCHIAIAADELTVSGQTFNDIQESYDRSVAFTEHFLGKFSRKINDDLSEKYRDAIKALKQGGLT